MAASITIRKKMIETNQWMPVVRDFNSCSTEFAKYFLDEDGILLLIYHIMRYLNCFWL